MGVIRAGPFGGGGSFDLVATVGQDVAHMAVLSGTQFERQSAGRLHALRPVALGQAEQAKATAVAVLGVAPLLVADPAGITGLNSSKGSAIRCPSLN